LAILDQDWLLARFTRAVYVASPRLVDFRLLKLLDVLLLSHSIPELYELALLREDKLLPPLLPAGLQGVIVESALLQELLVVGSGPLVSICLRHLLVHKPIEHLWRRRSRLLIDFELCLLVDLNN